MVKYWSSWLLILVLVVILCLVLTLTSTKKMIKNLEFWKYWPKRLVRSLLLICWRLLTCSLLLAVRNLSLLRSWVSRLRSTIYRSASAITLRVPIVYIVNSLSGWKGHRIIALNFGFLNRLCFFLIWCFLRKLYSCRAAVFAFDII